MEKIIALHILLFTVVVGYGQDGQDVFSIPWPKEYHWKIYDKVTGRELTEMKIRSYNWADMELIPGTETKDNWTIVGIVTRYAPTAERHRSARNRFRKEFFLK